MEGEKQLVKFIKALNILSKIMGKYDDSLFGQMAEVKELRKPEGSKIDFGEISKKTSTKNEKDKVGQH